MNFRGLAGALLAAVLVANVSADDVPFQFDDPAREQRYTALIEKLRCLVCQNQTLADSNAELAQDLRDEVFRMLQEGMDDDAIVAFLVERYGDFVLYQPPVKATTWLLWFGPFAMLLAAGVVVVRISRRRAAGAAAALTADERARLEALLDDDREPPP